MQPCVLLFGHAFKQVPCSLLCMGSAACTQRVCGFAAVARRSECEPSTICVAVTG